MATAFPLTDDMRDAVVRQQRRRRQLHAAAAKDSEAHGARLARKLLADNMRAPDTPVDVARRALQRRGYVVYSAAIDGGPPDCWRVDRRIVSEFELLRMAAA